LVFQKSILDSRKFISKVSELPVNARISKLNKKNGEKINQFHDQYKFIDILKRHEQCKLPGSFRTYQLMVETSFSYQIEKFEINHMFITIPVIYRGP